jgi:hypothetical protein
MVPQTTKELKGCAIHYIYRQTCNSISCAAVQLFRQHQTPVVHGLHELVQIEQQSNHIQVLFFICVFQLASRITRSTLSSSHLVELDEDARTDPQS